MYIIFGWAHHVTSASERTSPCDREVRFRREQSPASVYKLESRYRCQRLGVDDPSVTVRAATKAVVVYAVFIESCSNEGEHSGRLYPCVVRYTPARYVLITTVLYRSDSPYCTIHHPVWWFQIRPVPDSATRIPRVRAQAQSSLYLL